MGTWTERELATLAEIAETFVRGDALRHPSVRQVDPVRAGMVGGRCHGRQRHQQRECEDHEARAGHGGLRVRLPVWDFILRRALGGGNRLGDRGPHVGEAPR